MKRARDLGIPLQGTTGKWNAITDVKGVEVGHTTLISGQGKLLSGKGPVRTGVTAVLPRGKTPDPVFAGWFSLNGNGEMTGTTWVEESGFLEGPLMITNTHSVGVVRDAVVDWENKFSLKNQGDGVFKFFLPVVAETYDGFLNDINGFHVKPEHVFQALDQAKSGPVQEGNVGGGTGMICHRFKGGIGTSSRLVNHQDNCYTVGALVQSNYGTRDLLTIAGVPVGLEITDLQPVMNTSDNIFTSSSIIVTIATDAPLLPFQLKRLARRIPLGISKVGGIGANGSGDIFLAFSTANQNAADINGAKNLQMLSNEKMTVLFKAVVEAVEEAILNALLAAETMTGINGNTVYALPHERLQEVLHKYNRLLTKQGN